MSNTNKIVLFDGVCNLCNSSVQFLLKHDRRQVLTFASLQSDAAKQLLSDLDMGDHALSSIVFIDGTSVYKESDAVLRICRYLGYPWRMGAWFSWIPRGLRDAAYRFIARNRYKWFGKKDQCMLPGPEVQARFL